MVWDRWYDRLYDRRYDMKDGMKDGEFKVHINNDKKTIFNWTFKEDT